MKRTMNLVLAATAALVNPGCAQTRSGGAHPQGEAAPAPADLVLTGGVIHTQAKAEGMPASTSAIAVRDGRIVALGDAAVALADDAARVVDLAGRTVIPGLDDSHLHAVRGGRFYNLELRWDGVPSLAVGLERIREQAARTSDGHWVRVVGGWSPFQFEERRMPTVQELNAAAPHTPVFVLFLYSKGFLNRAAVEALGLTEDTPAPEGTAYDFVDGGCELLGVPRPTLLYQAIGKLPGLTPGQQDNSTLHWYRELNRFGLTSCSDPGGGGHNYPEDYGATARLAQAGEMPIRIAYYLFPQKPNHEERDLANWVERYQPGLDRAAMTLNGYLLQGAGENLVWAAGDYENFLAPRPTLDPGMDRRLQGALELLLRNNWPVRIHATYNESVTRFLSIFERVDETVRLAGRRWALDHVETLDTANLERVRALGGGVAIQDRMAYAGEYFIERYGSEAASHAPPLRQLLESGIPLGAGTDGTRVSSYNPWVSLAWMVTGRTVGGTQLYGEDNRLTRAEALTLYTVGSAWFGGADGIKGRLVPGQLADLAVLSEDYFTVDPDRIAHIESVLTVVGGRIVYGAGEYAALAPELPPVQPAWSPVAHYGGFYRAR